MSGRWYRDQIDLNEAKSRYPEKIVFVFFYKIETLKLAKQLRN